MYPPTFKCYMVRGSYHGFENRTHDVQLCSSVTLPTEQLLIAANTIIIIHDLLPSGLVAQSVVRRTIKSADCGLDSLRGRRLFVCLVRQKQHVSNKKRFL